MKLYQVTIKDKAFARKIANQINKDYPKQAIVKGGCCFITEKHRHYCTEYVKANCQLKSN